jgi:small glutamine-rich tetratricopeptide repeat-containing protein alpha
VQCIGEAFGVDASDEATRKRLSVKPATLPSIFEVYMKTRDKMQSPTPAPTKPVPQASSSVSDQDKAAAEKHKVAGNAKMSAKDYATAIAEYTHAIALDSTNPVYYSNRAAAYSSSGDHASAVADAEKAIQVDPMFVKAYHRLG